MTTALNLTLPIKQDPATLQRLAQIKAAFATTVQPALDAALRESKIVHYARVLVIDDKYIQVITEFDGDKRVYTEFFRDKLQGVFETIFSLADGVPNWDELNHEDEFYRLTKKLNLKSLGTSTTGDDEAGYLFSAYPNVKVKQILEAFSQPVAGT
jgi:hypothetical protein